MFSIFCELAIVLSQDTGNKTVVPAVNKNSIGCSKVNSTILSTPKEKGSAGPCALKSFEHQFRDSHVIRTRIDGFWASVGRGS